MSELNQDKPQTYQKLFISLRYFLIGKSQENPAYLIPLKALEYAKGIHKGLRKDGKTPEFQHQLEIAHFLRTQINNLLYPAETLAVAILHDVPEDYDISFEEIESLFGTRVMISVRLLTKKYRGTKKDSKVYFAEMALDAIASVVKGADRINNQGSMQKVFTLPKQLAYMTETTDDIIPMLKKGRHLFVEQESVYENIKFVLKSQMQLTHYIIEQAQLVERLKNGENA